MKKKFIMIGLLLPLFLLCGLIFYNVYKPNKLKEDSALKKVITKTIKNSDEIDFAEITDFNWDKMYVFTPYSLPKQILNKDGISSVNSQFSIEVLDTINMIGFVNSDKLVAFVNLPRNYGGSDLTNYIVFNKEDAKFNILQDKKTILFKY